MAKKKKVEVRQRRYCRFCGTLLIERELNNRFNEYTGEREKVKECQNIQCPARQIDFPRITLL